MAIGLADSLIRIYQWYWIASLTGDDRVGLAARFNEGGMLQTKVLLCSKTTLQEDLGCLYTEMLKTSDGSSVKQCILLGA